MQNKLTKQKLTLLSALLLLLFTYPFISTANRKIFIAGIPVLYLYIFLVWFLSIVALHRLADRKPKKPDEQ